jgi:hypothetical protein
VTKQSKWSIPNDLKVFTSFPFHVTSIFFRWHLHYCYNYLFFQIARELAEKASNQHSDRETGTTPALVGSASAEPSALPVNQSSSAIGSIDSSSLDASAKSVPAGVGPSLVDNTSASNNINMQNGGPSIAVVPVTPMTEVPSATDAGAIRFLQLL